MIRNFWPACIIFFYVFSCNIIEVNRFCIVLLYCYIMLLHFHKQMFLSNRLILLFHCLNLCCYFNINLFFLWSLYDFFLLVWFWHYLIPSGFSCYKLHIFSHISIVFPNAAWLISLKNLFQNHFLYFFFLSFVFISMYGFNQASWLNLMTLCTFFNTNPWFSSRNLLSL